MKILFAVAHPDDEAYGPYGTIAKLAQQGHDVSVCCLCNGNRPTAQGVASSRTDTFVKNCKSLNVKWKMWDNNDLSLTLNETAHLLTELVKHEQFDVIYTHNRSDVNHDHRVMAEASLIAARPKPDCSVNELYYFEIPSSTDWSFYKLEPVFQPNTYVELSEELVKLKASALSKYETETYQFPDARSVEAMTTLAKYRGYQVGYPYAEAFQLVFSRCRINE